MSFIANPHLKADYYSAFNFGTKLGMPTTTTQKTAVIPSKSEEDTEDKLILSDAVEGQVVTRFPPEASGYLHIGHAKAALINSMLRTKYKGKLVFRFDDTNPDKERHEFELAIIEDLGLLGVTWDVGPTYSSQYFDILIEKVEILLQRNMAYCDTTPTEEMRKKRFDGVATSFRNNSVEENFRLWQEMKKGSPEGQTACLRAKISVDDDNKAMRDPTLYRVNLNPHPRTGSAYKVYPTYDWCCPIVDSIEGVTHALRTNEYHDRNAQYYWILDQLQMRKPIIEDFSRLNMEYSLMSKRKLTQLVDDRVVDGWDDPRFPTVRGLVRRGLQIEALKSFVKVQGMSKAINLMEWSKLWNFNNQILDPSVPRYTAVSDETKVRLTVLGTEPGLQAEKRLRHKKNEALGLKTYYKSHQCWLDAEDVALLNEGDEVTLMDWCNAVITNISKGEHGLPVEATATLHPEGDVKKTKYKLSWIPQNPNNVNFTFIEFDHLLTKKKPDEGDNLDLITAKTTKYTMRGLGEEAISEVQRGQCLQIERRGFYRVDSIAPLVLFSIPDGRDKVNHLSAKAQFLKTQQSDAAPASSKKNEMSLEEKRAAKAAKKAASSNKH